MFQIQVILVWRIDFIVLKVQWTVKHYISFWCIDVQRVDQQAQRVWSFTRVVIIFKPDVNLLHIGLYQVHEHLNIGIEWRRLWVLLFLDPLLLLFFHLSLLLFLLLLQESLIPFLSKFLVKWMLSTMHSPIISILIHSHVMVLIAVISILVHEWRTQDD